MNRGMSVGEGECTPPNDIIGKKESNYMAKGETSYFVRELMEASRGILETHPVNAAREDSGKLAATSIWLWGQGGAPKMETFGDRFGLRGAVSPAVDLVDGIGSRAGLEVMRVRVRAGS